jgi:hypothetical protein
MPGAKQLKVTLVNRQNRLNFQTLSHRHNHTINKVNSAVGVFLQDFSRAG